MGRRQVVRQRILIPSYGGSNPPAPARLPLFHGVWTEPGAVRQRTSLGMPSLGCQPHAGPHYRATERQVPWSQTVVWHRLSNKPRHCIDLWLDPGSSRRKKSVMINVLGLAQVGLWGGNVSLGFVPFNAVAPPPPPSGLETQLRAKACNGVGLLPPVYLKALAFHCRNGIRRATSPLAPAFRANRPLSCRTIQRFPRQASFPRRR